MKHVTYSDKSLLVGDIAADLLMRYAAALANTNGADTVDIRGSARMGRMSLPPSCWMPEHR